MRWIESGGGPLVLLPVSRRAVWQGADGPRGLADYDRACEVSEYAGVVRRGGVDVLVLGDEPLRTAQVPDRDHPTLIRWMYAPDETSALAALDAADLESSTPVEEVAFTVEEEDFLLLDAAVPGSSGEGLAVRLVPGTRRLRSYVLEDFPEVRLLVHVLV